MASTLKQELIMTRLFKVTVNGRDYDVAVLEMTPGATPPTGSAPVMPPALSGDAAPAAPVPVATHATALTSAATSGDEVAQLGGVIVQIDVRIGQTVTQGQSLLVLEAMKMKNHLLASRSGQVTRVMVAAGDAVEAGQPLLTIQ
jgi:glutaconyl-CoA/methylmalonyl-CoA decarboxylase subunit gamma